MIDASELTFQEREKLTHLIESGYNDLEVTNCRACGLLDCEQRAKNERLPVGVYGGKGLCPKLSGNRKELT